MKIAGGNYCSAVDCYSNYGACPGLSMFRFPKDPERCKKWLVNTGREDIMKLDSMSLYTSYRLCAKHFEDGMFMDPKKTKLMPKAIPTIFSIPNSPMQVVSKRKLPNCHIEKADMVPIKQSRSEPKSCDLKDSPHPKLPSENAPLTKLKKKIVVKKRKMSASDTTLSKEIKDVPEKIEVNNNQIVLSNDNFAEKNQNVSNSSSSLPTVSIKIEKPWQEEYNIIDHPSADASRDCDKIQIEIADVWSVLNKEKSSSFEKADKNKVEITGRSSTYARPLKIKKREETFGKLVASEMSNLCENPELYFKTKQAILNILVQAQYEQLKSSGPIL